jgi:hypothetical protein
VCKVLSPEEVEALLKGMLEEEGDLDPEPETSQGPLPETDKHEAAWERSGTGRRWEKGGCRVTRALGGGPGS